MLKGKILVVIDMQNDFINGVLGTPEAQALVEPMAEFIRNWDGEVIYTKDVHFNEKDEYHRTPYLETVEGHHLPIPHCIEGTDGWYINSKIRAAYPEHTYICSKTTFGSVELGLELSDWDNMIEEIYLCGVCTDICVISNAAIIRAYNTEAEITVIEDLCAGTTPEMHQKAIDVMRSMQINIKKAAEV